MRDGTGLGHSASLGKDKGWPVSRVAGGFPDFLLLGVQEAVHIERFSGVKGRWMLGFNQVDMKPAIFGELEVEAPSLVPVGSHFPPVDVGDYPHENFAFFSIARLHLSVDRDEVDQPDFVFFAEVLERRRGHEVLSVSCI